MVLVSSASGPRVSGCIRAPLNFRPYPVPPRVQWLHDGFMPSYALCNLLM